MIRIEKLNLQLEGKEILKNIDVIFPDQSFTVIIGRNGSGKSTLLKAIAGLIAHEGNIWVEDKEIKTLPRKERAKLMTILPQQRPLPDIDVATLVAHGRFPYLGFGKQLGASDREMVEKAMMRADVARLGQRKMGSLSGGERQRVYIAMMIAQDTKYILLDEPTTFLDVEYQLEVMGLLKSLHKEGKNIVMVAHDLPQALTYADNVVVLDEGTLVGNGVPAEIYKESVIKDVFSVELRQDTSGKGLYRYQLEKSSLLSYNETLSL